MPGSFRPFPPPTEERPRHTFRTQRQVRGSPLRSSTMSRAILATLQAQKKNHEHRRAGN
jgi:hypothetical protein